MAALKPVMVPLVGGVTMAKVSASPSASLPGRVRVPVVPPSATVKLSPPATGGSATGVTVMVTVAGVVVVPPAVTV